MTPHRNLFLYQFQLLNSCVVMLIQLRWVETEFALCYGWHLNFDSWNSGTCKRVEILKRIVQSILVRHTACYMVLTKGTDLSSFAGTLNHKMGKVGDHWKQRCNDALGVGPALAGNCVSYTERPLPICPMWLYLYISFHHSTAFIIPSKFI